MNTIAKCFLLVAFLILPVYGQQDKDKEDEKVTIPKSMLTQDQINKLNSQNIKEDVHSWVGVGHEVGTAVNESLAAITTQANNFAHTGVGKVTVALVVWKVIGEQAVHLVFGLLEIVLFLPIFLWSYRRMCMDKRVVVKDGGWFKEKEYKVISYRDNWINSEFTPREGHCLALTIFSIVNLITIFSF